MKTLGLNETLHQRVISRNINQYLMQSIIFRGEMWPRCVCEFAHRFLKLVSSSFAFNFLVSMATHPTCLRLLKQSKANLRVFPSGADTCVKYTPAEALSDLSCIIRAGHKHTPYEILNVIRTANIEIILRIVISCLFQVRWINQKHFMKQQT